MNKAIIFDVDGTLIYTDMEYPRRLIRKVINELDGRYDPEKVHKFWWGSKDSSRREIVEREFKVKSGEFFDLYHIYAGDFEFAKGFKKRYGDVRPVLTALSKEGIPLGLVTDAPSNIALPQIDYFLSDWYFSEIITTPDLEGVRDKPEPDGLLLCMNKMGIDEACFVGDADSDMVAARKAGIEAILIDRGEHETEVEPDRRIISLYELYDN